MPNSVALWARMRWQAVQVVQFLSSNKLTYTVTDDQDRNPRDNGWSRRHEWNSAKREADQSVIFEMRRFNDSTFCLFYQSMHCLLRSMTRIPAPPTLQLAVSKKGDNPVVMTNLRCELFATGGGGNNSVEYLNRHTSSSSQWLSLSKRAYGLLVSLCLFATQRRLSSIELLSVRPFKRSET